MQKKIRNHTNYNFARNDILKIDKQNIKMQVLCLQISKSHN